MKKRLSDLGKLRIGKLNSRYGSKLTEEHIQILRESNLGKIMSQEIKDKISNTKKGFKMSEKTKKKMSENRIGKKLPTHIVENMKKNKPNRIKVIKIDRKTKQIICEYESIVDAAKDNNLHTSNISKCINQKAKSTGGFIWEKIDI